MIKIGKILRILSKGAIGSIIAASFSINAYASMDGILAKNSNNQYYFYDYKNLVMACEDNAIGLKSKLFDDYMSKEVVAVHDNKKGYIDYKVLEKAAEDAFIMEEVFDLDGFIEKNEENNIIVPEKIINVCEDEQGELDKEEYSSTKKSLNDIFREHEEYLRENKLEESLKILNYGIENYPNEGALYDERGCLYGGFLKNSEKAFADFEKAIKLNCISAYMSRAFYYTYNSYDKENYSKAIDDYDMFIKLAKDDEFYKHDQQIVMAYERKREYLRLMGKYDDIITSCNEVISLIENGSINFESQRNYKIYLATAYMDRAYAKYEGHSCLAGKDDVIKAHELAPDYMKERYEYLMNRFS